MLEQDQLLQKNYQKIQEACEQTGSTNILEFWINNRSTYGSTMSEGEYEALNTKIIREHGFNINS